MMRKKRRAADDVQNIFIYIYKYVQAYQSEGGSKLWKTTSGT